MDAVAGVLFGGENTRVPAEDLMGGAKMPLVSKAQVRWMYANKPGMAKKWAKETSDIKDLPEKKGLVKKKKGLVKRG